MNIDDYLTIDHIEGPLRKVFAHSDKHIKQVIDDFIDYIKENNDSFVENDRKDIFKFAIALAVLKKCGYLEVFYSDKCENDATAAYYDNNIRAIVFRRNVLDSKGHIPLFTFIHEVTHAMHHLMLDFEVPDEFVAVKEEFKKDECINIFLASYFYNICRHLVSSGSNDKEVKDAIGMLRAIGDIFDALLDGRLGSGVNITSLTYNNFLKLDPADEDFEEKKEAIMNEYNRVYNNKKLYDLDYNFIRNKEVICNNGHGSSYFKIGNRDFIETIADYMFIKIGCERITTDRKVTAKLREIVNDCLTTIFGDLLENFCDRLIDTAVNKHIGKIALMFMDLTTDDREFFRKNAVNDPLLMAFASEGIRNDKEFMLEFMTKVPAVKKCLIPFSRLVGKKLCSDIDFLNQLADNKYCVIEMANRGNLSKKDYTELAERGCLKNGYNVYCLDIDRLENGLDDYKKLALKMVTQTPSSFGRIVNQNELCEHEGGLEVFREIVLEASKVGCPLNCLTPYYLEIEKEDPLYYQIVLNTIKDDPFGILACDYDYLSEINAKHVNEVALANCLEKIMDEEKPEEKQYKVIGFLYNKLGLLDMDIDIKDDLNDYQLSIIKDKVCEDIRILKEKKNSEESSKRL